MNAFLLLFVFSGLLHCPPSGYQRSLGTAVLTAGTPSLSVMCYPGVGGLRSLPVGGRWRQMARAEGAGVEKQWAEAANGRLLLEKTIPNG